MKHLKKLKLLVQDHAQYLISIGLILIILSNGINNFLEYFDEALATNVYFMLLSLAFVFIGLGLPQDVKLFEFYNYLATYHLFDEFIGRGSIFDWWEIVIAVLTFIYVYRSNILKLWKH